MIARMFSGEREVAAIDVANRGLHYGDGLFETIRVHQGTLPLWPRHLVRLRDGAARLGIAMPALQCIESRIAEITAGCGSGVLKLLLTRGAGGRGYAPAPEATPTWMLALHPLPAPALAGLRLRWCDLRLASQPVLAGIKHCNRLEQVLARAECERAGCDEGLMRDQSGNAICATSANVLVMRGGRWYTPRLDDCGVAGVMRGWLLDQGLVALADLARSEVEAGEALALCNAVRGILPVESLGARTWAPQPALADLQERLSMAYPMFSKADVDA